MKPVCLGHGQRISPRVRDGFWVANTRKDAPARARTRPP
jgi:hypothetical protein